MRINRFVLTVLLIVGILLTGCRRPQPTEIPVVVTRATDTPALESPLESPISPPPTPPMPTATLTPIPEPTVGPPAMSELLPIEPVEPHSESWTPQPPPPMNLEVQDIRAWTQDYLQLVTDMLNTEGQDVDSVLDQLVAWMPEESTFEGGRPPSAWSRSADLDRDGEDEWIISVPGMDMGCMATFCPAYVLIFEKLGGLFKPVHVVLHDENTWILSTPSIVTIDDINMDGREELVLREDTCGANTCMTTLLLGSWDGQQWHNLAADRIEQTYSEFSFEDRDSDGVQEIVLFGGYAGSAGAGLQRQRTLVYAWHEGAYRQVEEIPEPSEHPYYLILDANTALSEGALDEALSLATKAIENENFEDPVAPMDDWSRSRIVAYAYIEVMLVHALQGDATAMEATYAQLQSHPNLSPNPYLDAAQRMLEVYNETGDPLAACYAMEVMLSPAGDTAAFFEWYGYNTERLSPAQRCPLD